MKIHRSRTAAEVVVVAAVEAEEEEGPAAVEAGAVVEDAEWKRRWSLWHGGRSKDVVDGQFQKPIEVLAEERQERSVAPLPTDTTLRTSTAFSPKTAQHMTSEMQEMQQEESVPVSMALQRDN
jgi:hypothetical protein